MLTYRNTEGECTLYSNLANRGGPACLASNRRIDVPEKVGGPASTSTLKGWGGIGTERSSATAAEVDDRLSHEDMNLGTGETGEASSVDAGLDPPSVAQGATVTLSGSGTDPDAGEVLV